MNPVENGELQMAPVKLAVVMPVGPACPAEDALDTIDSVRKFTTADRRIIVADDSGKGVGKVIQQALPEVEVVTTPRNMGYYGGLYVTLALAMAHVARTGRFEVLLRMDADALLIGPHPEDAAICLFREHPEIGIAGQYPNEYDGQRRDFSWEQTHMLKYDRTWRSLLRRPLGVWTFRRLFRQAMRQGYEPGDNVFGGANFMSEECVRRLLQAGLLPKRGLGGVRLQEDHLFSLLSAVVGLRYGDLSSGDGPFGCKWVGLPDSPERLAASGKKIIHSIRSWEDWKEPQIRGFFRQRREAAPA